jgi:hypothetical protein
MVRSIAKNPHSSGEVSPITIASRDNLGGLGSLPNATKVMLAFQMASRYETAAENKNSGGNEKPLNNARPRRCR